MWYLNVYLVTRHYGGPEEGGWYYDAGSPLASVPLEAEHTEEIVSVHPWRYADGTLTELETTDTALTAEGEELRSYLYNRFADYNRGDISSVLGGEEVRVYFENHVADHFPEHRPYYE